MLIEVNIDALVGPTHHYGGVGVGNVASSEHRRQTSRPKQAALEGLDKAAYVARLGIPQYLWIPPARPHPQFLSALGFHGDFAEQCRAAMQEAPDAYSATFSSAFMWAANAATFAPACDCSDQRNHVTVANLCSSWHRQPESRERLKQLDAMFAPLQSIAGMSSEVHPALPSIVPLRDEGAANHMRLCDATGLIGIHVFVYGENPSGPRPQRFLARQTLAACEAIARLHRLDPDRTFFLQQNPEVIDAGAFHNDVIATSHNDVLLYHEKAFVDADAELDRLERIYERACKRPLVRMCVRESDLSVDEAIASYLFNSQLLTPGDAADAPRMLLLCAQQCARMPRVRELIERFLADPGNPIEAVNFVTLDQSMSNGGGPACLRLRMQLPVDSVARFAPESRWTPARDEALRRAIERHYPDELAWSDLAKPDCLAQFGEAQAALASILR